MMRNLRGEMTVVGQEDEGENQELDVVAAISRALQLSSSDDVERIRDLLVPTLFFTAVSNCDIKRLDEIFSNVSSRRRFRLGADRFNFFCCCFDREVDIRVFCRL